MIELEEGEKVILEARRHWFIIYTVGAFLLMLAITPMLILVAALAIYPDLGNVISQPKFSTALMVFGSSWLLVLWIFFFVAWTDYYLDVLVVTNKRLIDVEQRGLFKRDIATIPLKNIQDVKVEINGFIRTMLKFGEIHIQTAGFSKELVIKDIDAPQTVKQVVMSAYHEHKQIVHTKEIEN